MRRYIYLLVLFLAVFTRPGLYGIGLNDFKHAGFNISEQDTLNGNQILYNGRLWRNLYLRIKEDQFLYSDEFLTGSVTIDGNPFKNIKIKYDIYTDEIITPTTHGSFLQLNKELVNSFNIIFQNKTYYFTKIPADSLKGLKGYVNVLYEGKNSLYVKYKKEIELLAVESKYDMFYQTYRIYFVKNGIVHTLNSKGDLLRILDKDKVQVRDFIKKNRLRISKKRPESFIPVIAYYDSISK
jgi:hypothetical protein